MKTAKDFKGKHQPGAKPDPAISQAITEKSKDGRLACALAFAIAKQTGVSPSEVGRNADLLDIRLSKCQLGLFGYTPQKRIVQPAAQVAPDLAKAIEAGSNGKRLPCAKAWEIAQNLQLSKMDVSSACEALGIKIKPCQLGAF